MTKFYGLRQHPAASHVTSPSHPSVQNSSTPLVIPAPERSAKRLVIPTLERTAKKELVIPTLERSETGGICCPRPLHPAAALGCSCRAKLGMSKSGNRGKSGGNRGNRGREIGGKSGTDGWNAPQN